MQEVRDPPWHRCSRWWNVRFICPYHRGAHLQPEGKDDEDPEDIIPIIKKKEKDLTEPTLPDVVEVVKRPVKEVVKATAQPEPAPAEAPVTSPAGVPLPAASPAPAPYRAPARQASRPRLSRNQLNAQARARTRAKAAMNKALTDAQSLNTKTAFSGGTRQAGGKPWSVVQQVAAAASAYAASGGRGSGNSGGPSGKAELQSAGLAEVMLSRAVSQRSRRGKKKSAGQKAVEEAERIVKPRRGVPVRERENPGLERAKRVAVAVSIGVGAGVAAHALRGGRGGGFHRQVTNFRTLSRISP